jgi:hypothetical protein
LILLVLLACGSEVLQAACSLDTLERSEGIVKALENGKKIEIEAS